VLQPSALRCATRRRRLAAEGWKLGDEFPAAVTDALASVPGGIDCLTRLVVARYGVAAAAPTSAVPAAQPAGRPAATVGGREVLLDDEGDYTDDSDDDSEESEEDEEDF
jgi:hypothetical protein